MTEIYAQRCREDLIKIFRRQTEKFLSLSANLVELKDIIAANDVAALNQVLQKDILPVDEINALEYERNQVLSIYGYDNNKDELKKCSAVCDRNKEVEAEFLKANNALSQLQVSIQTNDLLINQSKNRVRRALHILTGQNNLEKTVTYTHSGETRDDAEKRAIARA